MYTHEKRVNEKVEGNSIRTTLAPSCLTNAAARLQYTIMNATVRKNSDLPSWDQGSTAKMILILIWLMRTHSWQLLLLI